MVCIACFWATQPHDTYILKLLGIFNQTRHFQNQRIDVSAVRVENKVHQNSPTELISFSFSSSNILISFYFVCACVCILFSPSVTLKRITKRNIWTVFNMEFFEIKSFTPTNKPSHSQNQRVLVFTLELKCSLGNK